MDGPVQSPRGEGQGHTGQQIWMEHEERDGTALREATEEDTSGKAQGLGRQLNRGPRLKDRLDLALGRIHFPTTEGVLGGHRQRGPCRGIPVGCARLKAWVVGICWNTPLGVSVGGHRSG